MPHARRENLLAFSFFLLLAVVMTWPLLARLTTHVPLGTNDLWQNYWNFWWWKLSLGRGQSPYVTDLLFHPDGAPLGLHTHSPANMLLLLPANLAFDVGVAYNLSIFLGFVVAGFGGFLLCRQYTRHPGPALLGGVITAYFPQHVESSLEHLNLASYWALPLVLWSLVRSVREGGRWWLVAGLLFSLNALLSWHNALLSLPLATAVVAFETWRGSRPVGKITFDLVRAALVALLLTAPFAWPLLRDARSGVAELQRGFPDRSIDPLALFVPHAGQPLWGSAFAGMQQELRRYVAVGSLGYVGWVTVVLALGTALAPRRHRRAGAQEASAGVSPPAGASWLWGALCLFFLLLSFGDAPSSNLYRTPEWLRLPFYWLKELPLFGLVRLPNRFFVPAMLSLAGVVSIGVDRWLTSWPARERRRLVAALALLLALDYAWLPYPMRELPHPAWLNALDQLPADLAVLDVPTSHRGSGAIDMYLQTLHGRPIVSGYVTADLHQTSERLRQNPQLRRILRPPTRADALPARPTLVDSLHRLDTGLVVVHLDRTRERETQARLAEPRDKPNLSYRLRLYDPRREITTAGLDQIRQELRQSVGDPVYRSPDVEIYRLR